MLNSRAVGTLGIEKLNLQITFFMQRTLIQSLLICFRVLTVLALPLNVDSAISLMTPYSASFCSDRSFERPKTFGMTLPIIMAARNRPNT